jgi:8-oxo-dGTP pyrophosphatase MutT (NUDIX family)
MYKVFFDDRFLILQSTGLAIPAADLVLNLDGNESREIIGSITNAFRDNNKSLVLCLRSVQPEKTWAAFRSLFEEMTASGGVVFNPENKLLMIYRNGKWDLPKGKLEKGEEPAQAALREVEEECGISELKLIDQYAIIWHTYKMDDKYFLKKTYWYRMSSTYNGKLTPQLEEGITDVRWMSRKDVILATENTWTSIRELIREKMISPNDPSLK